MNSGGIPLEAEPGKPGRQSRAGRAGQAGDNPIHPLRATACHCATGPILRPIAGRLFDLCNLSALATATAATAGVSDRPNYVAAEVTLVRLAERLGANSAARFGVAIPKRGPGPVEEERAWYAEAVCRPVVASSSGQEGIQVDKAVREGGGESAGGAGGAGRPPRAFASTARARCALR